MVFRSKTDSTGDVKKPQQRGSRAPLAITIVVLALVGCGYYAYYRKQAEYYTGRNLRLLSMLTAQVEGRVSMFADFVSLKAKPVDAGGASNANDDIYSSPGLKFGQCSEETPAELPTPPPGRVAMRRDAVENARGWKLRLQAYVAQKSPTCASVSIDDVVRPIFTRNLGAAFDVLLVARDDGTVLYSVRPPPASSTLLGTNEEWIDEAEEPPPVAPINIPAAKPAATATGGEKTDSATPAESPADPGKTQSAMTDRDSGAPVLITNLKALQKRKSGLFSEYEAITPASLTTGTGHMTVSLNGSDYVLFTQPYTFSRKPASIHGNKSNEWVVCGLVSASRFRYDVSAVSASLVLIAIAVALLALCCWPYLRIALIHPSQPLMITDVVLIIVCTIVGAAVITLALLDAFAYLGITQTADEQLARFGEKVNDDFAADVRRAMTLLSKAEELTRVDAVKAVNDQKRVQTLPKSLTSNPAAGVYPYIDSIAWIDDDGKQSVRFGRILSPPKDVSARTYFKLAKQERTWTLPGNPPVPYVLEWVRSKATGEVRAVLAKKTEEAKAWDSAYHPDDNGGPLFSVIALATNLIDISDAIRPPGAEMAIIDENGEVIYHSDTQRIGYENFFTETDRNRNLRSAVVARRAGPVDATYWGDDQSMYVRPLTGSAWTLVTFRAKRLTRVLNVEATLLTLSLLLLSAVPYFVVYLAVLLLKPRYRAPRLWPDATRQGDYLRLCVVLSALVLLFALNNYALAPWDSYSGIVILPLLAMVTTYLVLHRTGAPRRFAIGTAVWIAVTAMLVAHMLAADIHAERFSAQFAPLVKAILVLATLGVAALTFILLGRGWKHLGRLRNALRSVQQRYGYATLYRLCGVLLIIIGVVLPVIGTFAISRHVEVELLVKYTQLRAAASLEQRIDHLATMNALPPDVPRATKHDSFLDVFRNPVEILFRSEWYLTPRPKGAPPPVPVDAADLCPDGDDEKNWTIAAWASNWLPSLYDDSIAIRPLFAGGASDKLWQWCRPAGADDEKSEERPIKLVRKVHLDTDVASFFWSEDQLKHITQNIVINSFVPRASLLEASDWRRMLIIIVLAFPLLAIFWFAADFVAKRVLLIDVHEPDWLARKPLSPTLGEHIFLVRRDRDLASLTKGLAFVDVSFASLDRNDNWSAVLEILDSTEAGRNVRVIDFEYGINDGAVNAKKLNWLERLLMLSDRTVIVSSAVSPSYIPTTPPPPGDESAAYFGRWTTLLQCFVTVTAEELDLRHEEWERRNALRTVSVVTAAEPKTWLEKETAHNAFLRRLYNELDAEADLRRTLRESDSDTDRRRLLDEICERAETYFAGLWSSCRQDEKLLLYQLAHDGLANGRNRRTLRRLIARGLVRRNPNLELFSESFRLYVLMAAERENIVMIARESRGASTWDSLRLPFFVIIISFLLLLFATQKDMLTTTTALATALTTGLPVLMKLVGVFTERRSDAKE